MYASTRIGVGRDGVVRRDVGDGCVGCRHRVIGDVFDGECRWGIGWVVFGDDAHRISDGSAIVMPQALAVWSGGEWHAYLVGEVVWTGATTVV